ncbi:MAG: STAS domain-containing protein [Bacteroidetes bacterium]|nr:STAS domain-containing protein [Bacteroidota bacterium]
MNIKERKSGDICVIGVEGRLDTMTYGILEKRLLEMIGEGQIRIVVDCSEMEYISSSGLRVFLMGLKKIKSMNGKFVLTRLPDQVHEIMEIAGFTTIFEIRKTEEEALTVAGN